MARSSVELIAEFRPICDQGKPIGMYRDSAEQRLGQVRAELAYTETRQIIALGLHEFLDTFQTKLNQVDQCIFDTFFALRPIDAGSSIRVNQ